MSCIELYYLIGRLNKDINNKKKTLQKGQASLNTGQVRKGGVNCKILTELWPFLSPRQSRRDIVLASSVCPSVHTFCLSGTIPQYLLVRFDSFLVQMISTMDSRYPISLVKIDPLTLELLPLFSICNY